MLTPGALVGDPSRRYQIVRAVGRGGMGEVYEALQVSLGRRVALKTIREDLAARAELLARFRREAESAAALGHPNLVQVTDFQSNPGEPPFLVMEMLEGATLKQVLDQSGRIEPARAAFIAVQLLSGLAAAHRAGIIHRDVKPGNTFLQSTTAMRDIVKVLDFGVAKLALESAPEGAAPMTRFGEVLGTLSYMAPEQAGSGGPIDARTDLYAVGATLFHALSGVRPFDATEPGGVRAPLSRIAPWVHRDLALVVDRALERSPDARWPSADAMAAALQPFASAAAPAPSGLVTGAPQPHEVARASGGWDPSAIGRLEAPTGGSSLGGSFPGVGSSSTYDASVSGSPRDASLLGHGARAPGQHVEPAYTSVPFASPQHHAASAPAHGYSGDSSYGAPPMVSSAAPIGAVPYVASPSGQLMPSAPPMPMAMQMHGPPQQPTHAGWGFPPPVAGRQSYAAPRKSPPWWILGVVAVVVLGAIPMLMSLLAVRRATDPSTIATNVEREVLKQPRQPCPPPDQCTQSREENGLTYPLCTRKLPQFTPYKPGDMVLVSAGGDDPRIALITTELSNRNYAIRFLTVQGEKQVAEEAIIGRLCTPGRRSGSAAETR